MSSANTDWTWLYDFWLRKRPAEKTPVQGQKKKDKWKTIWRICPSATGEPWISYAIGAAVLEISVDAVREKAGKLKPEYRHKALSCMFKLTGLETIGGEVPDDGEET